MAPDEDEKRLPLLILTLSHEGARGKSSPFRKGGKGEFDFLLFRHCEEQSDMAISATSYVILMSPVFSTGRREDLIFLFFFLGDFLKVSKKIRKAPSPP